MAGFGLNLKLVLYLQSQCLTESLGFLNPPLLQAAKRWEKVYAFFPTSGTLQWKKIFQTFSQLDLCASANAIAKLRWLPVMLKKSEVKQETQIRTAYETAKKVYNNEIGVTEGSFIIAETGINRSSAFDYIYAYSKLRDGKLYTRTINATTTDFYLNGIYTENGIPGLKIALLAMSQHIDYYEQTSGSSVKKGREIYNKYFSLVKDDFAETIFPDEVDEQIPFSEGRTRQVTVNIYERNPLARQECISFFGLSCQVCNFNFETKYGELGENFIHVHHLIEISTIGKEYSINPKTDLIPVCPNCHAMLHKRKPAYTIHELKGMIK